MIFHGQNAVVTGGANGIGLAISRSFVAAGGAVWILDLDSENPAEVARDIGAKARIVDVTGSCLVGTCIRADPRP